MSTNDAIIEAIPSSVIDYETLRQQGIAWLEKLTDSEWTDFNAHDPGITILEQVCYALTDLSYRINFDMEDLLSREGEQTYDSLYLPQQILVTKPVTLLDLRKLILDVGGVKNAWLEAVTEPQPQVFYLEKPAFENDAKVINLSGGEGASALVLQGLYKVLIEKSAVLDRGSNDIIQDVSKRLQAQRSLAVDFTSIQIIDTQLIQVLTSVEIDPSADSDEVYIAILEKIAAYIAPNVRFYSLDECLTLGKSIDEIFDGPLLDHGFIDNQELLGLTRRKNLYVSDLIREIMDVSGVRMVEYVLFQDAAGKLNDTALKLDADKSPKLDINKSTLTLTKRQLPIQLKKDELYLRYQERQMAEVQRPAISSSLSLPQGRDRHIARYYSLLQQFPKVYGLGESGLPDNVSEERKAQAKQLKAYLLFFDQLLANSFTQLAGVRDLFSFSDDQPFSYFAASLDDSGINELWVEQESDNRMKRLKSLFGSSDPGATDALFSSDLSFSSAQVSADWLRKNSFLDHLLARFAEQFTDYTSFMIPDGSINSVSNNNEVSEVKKKLLANKIALLRNYDQIRSSKGSGFNIIAAHSADNRSGLEQMLQLKLGVWDTEKLYVIEHALLRPIDGDKWQQGPLLSNALSPDPYSQQLTVVFFASTRRTDAFNKRFVEQIVRDETPAHLTVYLRWLDLAQADRFDAAYQDWQDKYAAYRNLSIQSILNAPIEQSVVIALRDARDRIIDWTGLGQTYPLRDLAVSDTILVTYNSPVVININNSQQGVRYSLCDNQQQPLSPEIFKEADGNIIHKEGDGKTIQLEIANITENNIYSIQATKLSSGLTTMLLQTPNVIVGLDLKLIATIESGQLLSASTTPAANDARIVNFGATVSVGLAITQEGVDYQLVFIAVDGKEIPLSESQRGNTKKEIGLVTTAGITEDIDIRIRATKNFTKTENRQTETGLLTTILPLKVRANPGLNVSVLTPIIDYSGAARIKIQGAQANILYQVLSRSIADAEFIHGAASGEVLSIAVTDKKTVQLTKPAITSFIVKPTDSKPGQGGDLELNLSNQLTEDTYIAILAVKTLQAKNGEDVTFPVALDQITAVLVRPDPNPALRFIASVKDTIVQAPIQVSGGQAGVFYEFTTEDNKIQGLPVYFHQRDRDDNTQNKGVGQLQVEVDLVISPASMTTSLNSASLPPALPELSSTATLQNTSQLSVRAFKAQSGVEVIFKRKVSDLLK